MKKIFTIIPLLLVVAVVLGGCGFIVSEEQDDDTVFGGAILDETLIENISKAMIEVGIDPEKVSKLERIDDWTAGERYKFVYKRIGLVIYTNMDATIHSIRLGATTNIYLEGYEAYNIEDYIVDSDLQTHLQIAAEDAVKSYLNYPSTADFPWMDWSFSRDHELYSVSSSVKAKNGFGVESDMPFTLTYKIQEDTSSLVYFIISNKVIVHDEKALERPERKAVPIIKDNKYQNTDGITLVYGQMGEYGKEVNLDGYKRIDYHVPQGTYTVKNNVKLCKFYVTKDEYFRNSDGYIENEIVETIELNSPNETAIITINQGEHIELTVNVSITLIKEQDL